MICAHCSRGEEACAQPQNRLLARDYERPLHDWRFHGRDRAQYFGGWHAFPKAPTASTLSLAFASDLILKGDSLGLTQAPTTPTAYPPPAQDAVEHGGAQMEKVTGIGGLFFRAHDPAALGRWYQEHLGVSLRAYKL